MPTDLPAAVLWDMDGTLIDSEKYWIRAEKDLAARFGAHWSDADAHTLVGKALLDSAAIFKARTSVPLDEPDIVDALQSRVVAQVRQAVPWRPGARELLAALRAAEVPCALVTMSYAVFAGAVVNALEDGAFSAIVAGDQVQRGKPDPEPYLRAATLLKVDPSRCVALEDSPSGVASALAAGTRVIAVPLMVPIAPAEGLSQVNSLTELSPDLLGEVVAGRDLFTLAAV